MIMKKILLLLLAALPLVFGSCSSDDEEINGTSRIEVTVTFDENDIANERNKHKYDVYLISTEGYNIVDEPHRSGVRYSISVKDNNGTERTLYSDWWAIGMTLDTEINAFVGIYGEVFPYGKCVLILEEWKGAARWFKYINTSLDKSNTINLAYSSLLMGND